MISHKYKCIFIHIPKCAGTSIESALGHFDGYTGRGGQDHRTIRMVEQPSLSLKTFSSIDNLMELARRFRNRCREKRNPKCKLTVTKQQYDQYFKFAVIRNPWTRVFSWYKNIMRVPLHKENYKAINETSFTDFLVKYAGKGNLRPQTYWLKNLKGEIPLDFIIRFENLSEEFNDAINQMNIGQITLPHKKKSPIENYQEYYTKKSIKVVEKVYKEEIEMFGYSFLS
jgi:hypothetical protein